MSLQAATVSLRGFYRDGRNVSPGVFLVPLDLSPSDSIVETTCDRGPWQSALVVFSRRRIGDFRSASEPHEAFAAALASDLLNLETWLEAHGRQVAAVKASGVEMDVFLDLWIEQDQLEICLPPPLLLACGQLDLKIEMITND